MKRKCLIALLLCCASLTACSKEQIADDASQAIAAEERVQDMFPYNMYRTVTDKEVVAMPDEFGFDEGFEEAPEEFYFNEKVYSASDFADVDRFWETLRSINEEAPLVGPYTYISELTMNPPERLENEARSVLETEGSFTFRFGLYDDNGDIRGGDDGLLQFTLDGDPCHITIHFIGDGTDSTKNLHLVYPENEVNVNKLAEEGPSCWVLPVIPDYNDMETEEPVADVEPVATDDWEFPIEEEDLQYLDNAITEELEMLDDNTYTGVEIIDVAGQYIRREDMNNLENTLAAVIRVAPTMNTTYTDVDGIPKTITSSTSVEDLRAVVDTEGEMTVFMKEYGGGTNRISWLITDSNTLLTVHPTGNDTKPRTRVFYGDDVENQWIPYDFKHVMQIHFTS